MIRALFATAAVVVAAVVVAPSAHADALWDAMPGGYESDSCVPVPADPNIAVAAAYKCGPNSLPGGPDWGSYLLFSDPSKMGLVFRVWLDRVANTVVPCPGGYPSPGVWHTDWDQNQPAGQIACGTREGNFALIWTRDRDMFFGAVALEAPNTETETTNLLEWWKEHGRGPHDFNPPIP